MIELAKSYDLIVIGGGPGGYEAALEAARLGLTTALVESRDLGGTCLNRGCIPTKTWIHSSALYNEAKGAGKFGIDIQSSRANLAQIRAHKDNTVLSLRNNIAMLLKKAKVDVYEGTGSIASVEPMKLVNVKMQEDSIQLEANNVLIATGSVPQVPPIQGMDLPEVMTSDELLDLDRTPSSILIIGGGVIGVEFACIWMNLGTKITIVEALPSLISNKDKELRQSLRQSFKKRGADVHLGSQVLSLTPSDGGVACTYREKDAEQTCESEVVLVATGRKPYTGELFGCASLPSMDRGFITVDDNFQSDIPGIYAIGDVSSRIQLAHVATAQGIAAVRRIAGVESSVNLSLIPSCIYTDPEIASVGLTLEDAQAQGLNAKSHKILSSANGKSVLTLQERGFMKVVYLEESRVIVGAHLLCARATDMISEFALAIDRGMTLDDIGGIIRPHPTFSEMITEAVTV